MIAITTRYHGPTNYRGSRIIASNDGRRHTVSYDHSLNADGNHARAAREWITRYLRRDYVASDTLTGGESAPGTMVWVFVHPASPHIVLDPQPAIADPCGPARPGAPADGDRLSAYGVHATTGETNAICHIEHPVGPQFRQLPRRHPCTRN